MSSEHRGADAPGRPRSTLGIVLALVLTAILAAGFWQTRLAGEASESASPTTVADADKKENTFTREFEDDEAFEGAPWAENLRVNLMDAWNNFEFNAASGWRMKDADTDYIDVVDGERRTVTPDPSLGEPLRVWFFGGSAAFGAGQRDEHTIPSELVRRAGQDGVALEVRNFGVPATVNWQSVTLMIEKLAWNEAPDVIVFYDGANDLSLQESLAFQGRATSDRPASLLDAEFNEVLRERSTMEDVTGGEMTTTTQPDPAATTPESLGARVFSRYSRGVSVARDAASGAGVPIRFFWQPQLSTKTPLSEVDASALDSIGSSEQATASSRALANSVRAGLPSIGVTDLSTTFDGQNEAIYWDSVHTNELGAALIAERMYAELGPELSAARSTS
jgi:lysophospholipase L1-like esterase